MWKEWDGTEAEAMDDEVSFEEREELRQLITRTAVKWNTEERYDNCRKASVGDIIKCPSCGTEMVKKSYQHVFCSNKGRNNCKDLYWNYTKPERMERIR